MFSHPDQAWLLLCWRTAVSAAVLAFLASCGERSPDDEAVDFAVGVLAGGAEFGEFRESYDLNVYELTGKCMRSEGFPEWTEIVPSPLTTRPDSSSTDETSRYFNIVDELDRRRADPGGPDATDAPTSRAVVAYDEAFDIAQDSCYAEAVETTDHEFNVDRIDAALAEMIPTGNDMGEATDLEEGWAQCMRNQGYDVFAYDDVDVMVEESWTTEIAAGRDSSAALALEAELFKADGLCNHAEQSLEEVAREIVEQSPELVELFERSG